MDTPQDFVGDDTQDRIVYVRPVDVADLPEQVRAQIDGVRDIYAVHAANGDRLALVNGRKLAFVLARQNDMKPVHVH
ncbi:DUF1150 domain-containing protein [Meridianimarinicoccus roseus]|jgi:hypothetical protein|uniref:DUF1150 domain-containing protein n=1 Tax=Meridianimarinicoccus roseus TaxID=2072018 RepID=A0A2V2LEF9_9RHOB|nr:DUF1150 family protein [Meridianimarinicoccus roseus]PWR01884.1 DUF1150 domain-containing protein [Meridianimarinicoccus roseus]